MLSRSLSALMLVLFMGGCAKETTFDEDYAKADSALKANVKMLDTDLNQSLKKEPGEDVRLSKKETQN
jgi:PBP1b-binding outer membrane lipoprotein LpoB